MFALSIEQIIKLHSRSIERYGGSDGVRDLGRLEAVVATQTQEVFGYEVYPELYDKAAAIMRGIIADHPFYDGNKRAGSICAQVFLEANGLNFSTKPGEIADFAVRVATDHLEVDEISDWLSKHCANN